MTDGTRRASARPGPKSLLIPLAWMGNFPEIL